MKNYLLPQNGSFFKANMHCHSTLSDGNLTVEEIKALYKNAGYSIVAFTDHNVLIDHSDLADDGFMPITGYEYDVFDEKGDRSYNHTPLIHVCFYAKDQHNDVLPCCNAKQISARHADLREKQKYSGTPDYVRSYKNINETIAKTCSEVFLASLCHPTWSEQDLDEYRSIEGIFAMEILNYGCLTEGYNEINDHAYDDLCRRGKKIYCIASDDNHNNFPPDSPKFDSLGGFIMIKAPELEYSAIMKALENGDFYASSGPEIYEMWTEGEELHIKTSPAARISLTTYGRRTSVCTGEKKGDLITEATLACSGLYDRYCRVTVDDGQGHFAWTRAYFDCCKMENGRYDGVPFRK